MALGPPAPVQLNGDAQAYKLANRAIANRIVTLAIIITVGVLAFAGVALVGAMVWLRM